MPHRAVLVLAALALGALAAQTDSDFIQITVYRNGEWAGAEPVAVPRAVCASADPTASPAFVCGAIGLAGGNCTLHAETGLQVHSCADLRAQPALWAVPQEQRFMYAPLAVGREVVLTDLAPLGNPVVLRALSQRPRVFEIINFFSEEDADFLISNALSIKAETHRLKRSTTGSENVLVDRKRTSESAFDISSAVAKKLKRRTQELLRFGPYDETVMDGFQILRYNVSAAYNDHLDYIETSADAKYDTRRGGTNRFATVLFYLNTVEVGGETVFPNADAPAQHVHMIEDTAREVESDVEGGAAPVASAEPRSRLFRASDVPAFLAAHNASEAFPEKGFERTMLVRCRTKFTSRPLKLRAVLFYSQLPDLSKDSRSLHGGCPVVKGEKWLANLWIWNGPRHEFWEDAEGTINGKVGALRPRGKGELADPGARVGDPPQVLVSFEAVDVHGAHLFWEETDWGVLEVGFPVRSNSYAGHVWSARLDGKVVKTFVVPNRGKGEVNFYLSKSDIGA